MAAVPVLADTAAPVQPRVGTGRDAGRLQGTSGAGCGVVLAGGGLVLAAVVVGFAAAAGASPEGRLGQATGAAEVGRELGDAGGRCWLGRSPRGAWPRAVPVWGWCAERSGSWRSGYTWA